MKSASTALFIDTFKRGITVSTVSASQVSGKGLTLRYGAHVGNLWEMTADPRSRFFKNESLPVIVATRGYKARSSAGFVEVVADWKGDASRVRSHVLGVQGFPWQKTSKGLSVLGNPMEVLVLRPGTNICQLETHARREAGKSWHSNLDCAAAAVTGVKLRSTARPKSVFVIEGQSDYAQAWELAAFNEAYAEKFEPEFQEEFRSERFTLEELVFAGLRTNARRKGRGEMEKDQERIEATVFVYLNLLLADEPKFWQDGKGWKDSLLPWYTLHMVGPRLREVAEYLADTLRKAGWKLGMDTSVGNHFLQANKAGKMVVYGWGAVHGPKEYEGKLIELLDSTPEAKAELRSELEARDQSERAWTSHVGA